MCIAIFSFNPSSTTPLTLGFNRDELYTRESLEPDYYWNTNTILAPLDKQEKGSWIGVNTFGLVVCIINKGIKGKVNENDLQSRGLIVIDALKCQNVGDILVLFKNKDLRNFKPFNLLAFNRERGVVVSNYDRMSQLAFEIEEIESGIHLLSKTYLNDLNHPRIKQNINRSKKIDFSNTDLLSTLMNAECEDMDSSMIQKTKDWGTVSTTIIQMKQDKIILKYQTDINPLFKDYEIKIYN